MRVRPVNDAHRQAERMEERYFAEQIRIKRIRELARRAVSPIAFLYAEEGQFDDEL